MFNWLRRSESIQEILVVRAEDLRVEDRFVYDKVVVEVVAVYCGAKMMHVILRPIHPEIVTLDEYHEKVLYPELKIQINRFK